MYVFDRRYNDYRLFGELCSKGVFFVTRRKDSDAFEDLDSKEVPNGWGMISDEKIELTGFYPEENYRKTLRRIRYFDQEQGLGFTFLPNNLTLSAETIAMIYKERWQVELFFKAIKQNLKIKTFVGTSTNVVKIQIWTALIAIFLLRLMKLRSSYSWALLTLATLLSLNLFIYRDLWHWLNAPFEPPPEPLDGELMALRLVGGGTFKSTGLK